MTEVHHRPRGGQGRAPSAAVDLANHAAAQAWLTALTEQVEDLAAAGEDATRPPGERDLGRRSARRMVLDARDAIRELLDAAQQRQSTARPG